MQNNCHFDLGNNHRYDDNQLNLKQDKEVEKSTLDNLFEQLISILSQKD